MNTNNQHREDQERSIQDPDQTPVYNNRPDERRDDLPQDEEEQDNDDANPHTDWGDVDPAGGDAPTSPGSAV